MNSRGFSCRWQCIAVLGILFAALGTTAGAAELPTARPADVGLSAERLARLDAAMQAEVDAGRKAGIVALIARRGRVAHLKAFGMADRETNVAMRDDSLFRLYSMTKPVTSVALLMLYEEGKFQSDDPLEKYIPAFKDVQVLAGMDGDRMRLEPAASQPTIHDVFRHTAGFSYGFNPQDPIDRAYAENGVDFGTSTSLKQLVSRSTCRRCRCCTNPAIGGSTASRTTCRRISSSISPGMPFDEFCRTRIFEPLGMTRRDVRCAEVGTSRATRPTMRRAIPRIRPRRLVRVETREGVPPPSASSGGPLGGRLRALHGHSVRRLEHVVDGDGLRAVRADARERRRAER